MTIELAIGELMEHCIDSSTDRKEGYASYLFVFENGYGACVTKRSGGIGYDLDLWEVAIVNVIRTCIGVTYRLCYDTPITNNVVGSLTDAGVVKVLGQIKGLRAAW